MKKNGFLGYIAISVSLFGVVMLFAPPAFAQNMEYFEGAIYPTGRVRSGSSSGGTYYYPQSGGSGSQIARSLSASCSPNALSSTLGQNVVWFSSVSGGAGTYAYFWGGSDGLSGNTSSVMRAYTNPGQKAATLSVVSGGQSVTVNCTSAVYVAGTSGVTQTAPSGLGASCYTPEERIVPGESGTWLAVVTGLDARTPTSYSWEGTEGLTGAGPAAFKTYATQGRKYAVLTITNGTTRSVTACTNNINVAPRIAAVPRPASKKPPVVVATTTPAAPALQGICTASVAKGEVDSEVTWRATSVGASDTTVFSWTGDEGLSGSTATIAKKYDAAGTKRASVTITAGDKSVTVPCTPIEIVSPEGSGLLAAGFFSLKNALWLVIGAFLAAMIGIYFAMRKRRREEAEAEDEDLKPKH